MIWSAGEHDQSEGRGAAVEASGTSDDEAYDGVEDLGAGVVDAQSDRGEDPVAVLADGLGGLDERG
jgi:hypothetical protein